MRAVLGTVPPVAKAAVGEVAVAMVGVARAVVQVC